MKFLSCREGAAIIPVPGSRRVELRAVMLREFINPKRLTPLAHRGHTGEPALKMQPDVIYAGHTGICVAGAAVEDCDFRATAEAWKDYGLTIRRAELVAYPGGDVPELVIYFTVFTPGEQNPNPTVPLFQLILPHGEPAPTQVHPTHRAPAPGIKYAADKAVPPRPQMSGRNPPPGAPQGGPVNAEAAARAWLQAPDPNGRIVSQGAENPPAGTGGPLTAPPASVAPPAPVAPAPLPAPAGTPVESINLGTQTGG